MTTKIGLKNNDKARSVHIKATEYAKRAGDKGDPESEAEWTLKPGETIDLEVWDTSALVVRFKQ